MKVVRSTEAPWIETIEHGRFSQREKTLSPSNILGCALYELPAGKTSFPMHLHHVAEEAMFVLSGRAKVRTPAGLTELGPGDWVTFPVGGPAHQLINDGADPLSYLAFSVDAAADHPDVVDYPDSGKIGAGIGVDPDRKRFRHLKKDAVDYFLGEED